MGNTASQQTNDVLDSDTIRRNIMQVFREKNTGNNYTDFETIGWNNDQYEGLFVGGGTQTRNRYDQFNPESLVNDLIEQNKRTQQSANKIPAQNAQVGGNEYSEYKEISEDVLSMLKRHIVAQTGGAVGNTCGDGNANSGGCGCDGKSNPIAKQMGGSRNSNLISATSANTIDYSVFANKNKQYGGGDDDANEDDDEDDEDDDEDEDDEDEDDSEDTEEEKAKKLKNKNNKDSEDSDEPKVSRMNPASKIAKLTSRTRAITDSSNDGISSDYSSEGISRVLQPFYSSDSDHFNVSRRRNRY